MNNFGLVYANTIRFLDFFNENEDRTIMNWDISFLELTHNGLPY
jgi:hypothetical protein